MTTDSYIRAQYLQLIGAGFFIFVLFLCHVTSKLAVSRSRPPVAYGANFFNFVPIISLESVKLYALQISCAN